MNNILKIYGSLCTPAKAYLLLSVTSVLGLITQNLKYSNKYTVGSYTAHLRHTNIFFFIFKIIYIALWTHILNQLCKYGWKDFSWFLVLFPYILMFVLIGLLIWANTK